MAFRCECHRGSLSHLLHEELEDKLSKLEHKISSLEDKMREHDDARNLLLKKEALEDEKNKLDENNPNLFKAYRKNLQDGWKIIIQKNQ